MSLATDRTTARQILVRHLTEAPILRRSFADQLAGILDDLTTAGILPPAPPVRIPRQRTQPRLGPLVEGYGAAVVDARRNRGWTLRELAAAAEVAVPTVQKIERDRPVRLPKVVAVLTALDLTPET